MLEGKSIEELLDDLNEVSVIDNKDGTVKLTFGFASEEQSLDIVFEGSVKEMMGDFIKAMANADALDLLENPPFAETAMIIPNTVD